MIKKASAELETFIDEGIKKSQEKGYHPTVFIGMRERHGTIEAISRLVESGDIQSGFKRLQKLDLIDWTIEAAVVKFSSEFSRQAQECAEFRLRLAKDGA